MTIDKLMGFAMSVMHISFSDFAGLDVDEFETMTNVFLEYNESCVRMDYERDRLFTTLCVRPFVSSDITPAQLVSFPWDKDKHDEPHHDKLTKEQVKARMDAALKKMGATY